MSYTVPGRGMRCGEALILNVYELPADHAWRTITESDEMQWNEINEIWVEKWWN